MSNNDTTGTIIACYVDIGTKIIIARDTGHYPDTKPAYNVRSLDTLHTLDISVVNPVFEAIVARDNGYGCGWGGTGQLHPITDTDIAALLAEHARSCKIKADREAKKIEQAAAYYNRVGQYLCPHCGTFCHGDCQA